MKGIENFKKLRSLDCSDNRLTKLDVSKNTKLEALYCGGNSLTELDVSRNTALQLLACDRNQLTELNVSKNTALVELNCSQNKLSALDTTKCANLEVLYCANNQSTKKLTVNVAKLDGLNLSTTGAQGNVEIKVNGAAPSGKPVTGTLDAGGMRLTLSQNGKVKYMTIIVGDQYRFDAVVNGKYTLTAEDYNYDDYVPRSTTVTVTNGTITGMDGFKLARSGDVNLDGTLDVYDLQLLYEYVSKIAEVKDDYVKAVADMNGKNGVEITDVQRLYAILTGTGINSAMTG